MSQQETAYERADAGVLEQFAEACMRLGVSQSGLCISFGGGHDWLNAKYFEGVILARLRGRTPPFRPGQKLRVKAGEKYSWYNQPSPDGKVLTVERVYFDNQGRWTIAFDEFWPWNDEGRLRDRYPADRFEVVPE